MTRNTNPILSAFRDDRWLYKSTHQATVAWLSAWSTLRQYDVLFQQNPTEARKAKKVLERLYTFTEPK